MTRRVHYNAYVRAEIYPTTGGGFNVVLAKNKTIRLQHVEHSADACALQSLWNAGYFKQFPGSLREFP